MPSRSTPLVWLSRHPVCLAVILAFIAFALFARTLAFPFVNYDDGTYVFNNPHVMAGLNWDTFLWSFTALDGGNWHPLTWLTLLLDSSIGSGQPWAFHLSSTLFHALSVAFLFLALARLTRDFWPSALVALLWGVHPLRAESVAWVSERKDVLSALFFALTLLAYARYVESKTWPRYLLVMLAFILGLMAKPMLVTLPFVLLLLDIWPLGRLTPPYKTSIKTLLIEKAPMLPVIVAISMVTFVVQRHAGMMTQAIPLPARALNALVAYAAYLLKMAWPTNLAVLYPYSASDWAPAGQVILAGLVFLAFSAIAFWGWHRNKPYFLVGWLWYLGMLIPVIGLVQVGGQTMADRYTHLPMIGILIALVWSLADLARSPGFSAKTPIVTVSLVAVTAAACLTAGPTLGYWQNSVSLWTQAVRVTPDGSYPRAMLAAAFFNQGDISRAGEEALIVTQTAPNISLAQQILTASLLSQGRAADALMPATRACELTPANPENWRVKARVLEAMGRPADALQAYTRALETASTNATWLDSYQVGRLFSELNHHAQAIAPLTRAVALAPQNPTPRYLLADALAHLGQDDQARTQYQAILALPPSQETGWAHNGLGALHAKAGRWHEAASSFTQAARQNPSDTLALANLALALENAGDAKGALAAQRAILAVDPSDRDARAGVTRLLSQTSAPSK